MQTIEAGVLYFALVFGAGFVLGTVRTLWVAPRVGARKAELMETPIMLVVTILVCAVDGSASRCASGVVCPPWNGRHRPHPPARRRVRVHALASSANDS